MVVIYATPQRFRRQLQAKANEPIGKPPVKMPFLPGSNGNGKEWRRRWLLLRVGLLAGLAIFDLQDVVFAAGIDGGECLGASAVGAGAIAVSGVGAGLFGESRGECGYGLLSVKQGDLNGGTAAVPFHGVFAAVEGLAFDNDFVGQLHRGFVGFCGDCG